MDFARAPARCAQGIRGDVSRSPRRGGFSEPEAAGGLQTRAGAEIASGPHAQEGRHGASMEGDGSHMAFPLLTIVRRAALPAALALGACGGGVSSDRVDDPVARNVVDAASRGTSAAVAAGIDCGNMPDFVPVYPGGRVTHCVASRDGRGPRHVSGSIVYVTRAAPRRVLGWSRERADALGLRQRRATKGIYSAGDESQRSLMIVAEPVAGGTRVTVNWGSGV